jgi:hypothetical protein
MIDLYFIQYGYDLFLKEKGDAWPGWNKMPEGFKWEDGQPRPKEGYYELCKKGYKQARIDYIKPHVVDFLKELKVLEGKYNCEVDTGCGCCGGGYFVTIDGKTFEFDPGDYKEENNND